MIAEVATETQTPQVMCPASPCRPPRFAFPAQLADGQGPGLLHVADQGLAISEARRRWGRGEDPVPGGRQVNGAHRHLGRLASLATSAIAAQAGVLDEPTSTSTLSSVTSLRAFLVAWPGSVASSSTM